MTRLIWIFVFSASVLIGHFAVLRQAPKVIMSKAMTIMGERGVPLHGFSLSPRITPKTQTIVRPSPDLAYSICRFDLSSGPVFIEGAKWDGYGSLTIFDAHTDAVFITSLDKKDSKPNSVVLSMEGQSNISKNGSAIAVLSKPRGLALIRRIAPTKGLYDQVKALSNNDVCEILSDIN